MRLSQTALLFLPFLPALAAATAPFALTVVPASPQAGQIVTLTTTLPASASGTVTFYDGVMIIGIAPVSKAAATLQTRALASGAHTLRAHYSGDSANASANSTTITQRIRPVPGGAFSSPVLYPVGSSATDFGQGNVIVGDFNGDLIPDLASADTNNVAVLLGNGDGTFQAPLKSKTQLAGLLVTGDFNGDGNLDLVAYSYGSGLIQVLLGDGKGTFAPQDPFLANLSTNIIGSADFNGDGKIDLVLAGSPSGAGAGTAVGVLLGKGDGTFQAPIYIQISDDNVQSLAIGDLNGDGNADFVVGSYAPNIGVVLGNGDGTFQPATYFDSGGNAAGSLSIFDLNNDGKPDLLVSPSVYNPVVLNGNGDGSLQFPTQLRGNTRGRLGGSTAADLNGDGFLDLIDWTVGYEGFGIQLYNPPETSLVGVGLASGTSVGNLVMADLDGDGRLDIVTSNPNNFTVGVLLQKVVSLQITSTHTASFVFGQYGASLTLTLTNIGPAAITDTFYVTDQLPAGFTANLVSGAGWTCSTTASLVNCYYHGSLAAGASLPPISLLVNVAANVSLPVTNVVDAGSSAAGVIALNDSINLVSLTAPTLLAPSPGQSNVPLSTVLSWAQVAGAASYDVYFGSTQPPPFVTNTTGTSYNPGSLARGTTYQWRVQAKNAAASASSPMASFSTAAPPPQVVGTSPSAGSGFIQTFTFNFTNNAGFQAISLVNVLINNAVDGRQACYLAVVPTGASSAVVYLVDDAGDAGGPYTSMTLPGSGIVQNSQCAIGAAGSSISGSGNNLTLTLAMNFRAGFTGNKIVYLAAANSSANSGWQPSSTWNVPGNGSPPNLSVVSISPAYSTASNGLLTFVFSDSAGAQDLAVLNVLINDALDGRHACYIAYVPSDATLYLVDDSGDSAGPYTSMPLPGKGSVANSQCILSGAASSVTASGNSLTLTLNYSFTSFSGRRVVYAAARSKTETSGWQSLATLLLP